jgi:diguanylate cyclase (GGDEF)-like protein
MRMGGDEFIVYAVGMADLNHVVSRLENTKASLHKIKLGSGGEYVTASIGCVINLGSYPDYDTLSAAADKLLYLVKEEGKDNFKCSAIEYKRE